MRARCSHCSLIEPTELQLSGVRIAQCALYSVHRPSMGRLVPTKSQMCPFSSYKLHRIAASLSRILETGKSLRVKQSEAQLSNSQWDSIMPLAQMFPRIVALHNWAQFSLRRLRHSVLSWAPLMSQDEPLTETDRDQTP